MKALKIMRIIPFVFIGLCYNCGDNEGEDIAEVIEETPEEPSTPTKPENPGGGAEAGTSNIIKITSAALLLSEIATAEAGDTLQLAAGTYALTSRIILNQSGTENKPIVIISDKDGAIPILDFSSMAENSSNQGFLLRGNYWVFKRLSIVGAGDNGMKIESSNNLIEFCSFSKCKDTGLQLDNGAANNLILNCDSFYNADSSLENADGFAAKLTVGSGNKFVGCRAWQNLDDGWDGYLRETDNVTTTYENCWAFKNGYLEDGSKGQGDGNGFKTGGSDDKKLKHNAVYTNCVAAGNVFDGFDHNSNRGSITIYNCSAYQNGTNINFSSTNIAESLTVKNAAVLGDFGKLNATSTDISNNSWMNGLTASAADFESIDIELLSSTRKADGSLPDIAFMHLVTDSDLIDAGVDVGLSFKGSAPDLGAFEKN
ncbi:right-handed parallel beta-helix repeat-containing protein [Leeuwenhoekiella sp. H156]|uniref:right-handed parallel beta-helix repeat-containing protein n=1 Tax=Leeuwenhoekiella sp. H156 TaxID=3450128 RepID=UPI003FA4D18E